MSVFVSVTGSILSNTYQHLDNSFQVELEQESDFEEEDMFNDFESIKFSNLNDSFSSDEFEMYKNALFESFTLSIPIPPPDYKV